MCHHQAQLLLDVAPQLSEQGIKLVVVGNGSAFFATQFKEGLPWPGEIYLDSNSSAFAAVNLQRVGAMQAIKRWLPAASWFKKNAPKYASSNMQGDGFQTGGVFLIGPGEGSCLQYSFKEMDHDVLEFASGADILKAASSHASSL